MVDNELDRIIREKLDGCRLPVDDSLWEGIQVKMAHRRRSRIVRTFSYGATAAAACVAAVVLLFGGRNAGTNDLLPDSNAHAALSQTVAPGDVAPVAEQIAEFTKGQNIVAQAYKPTPSTIDMTVVEPEKPAVVAPVSEDESPAESHMAENSAEQPVATNNQPEPEMAPAKAGQTYDKYSNLGYWDDLEPETSKRKHTSINISTNMGAVVSESGFAYQPGPFYAASVSGSNSVKVIDYDDKDPKFSVPLSFGLQLRIPLLNRLSLGTGVIYSYLETSSDALVNLASFSKTSTQLHYVGVPLNLYYSFVDKPKFEFYGFGGGQVDKCVKSRFVYGSEAMPLEVKGLQWGVSAGVGIQYMFNNWFGIYLDPTMTYFFDNGQPKSIRTSQPLTFSASAGFRIKL